MEILKPLGNLISTPVKNWAEIKKEAWELKAFIDAKKFDGYFEDAFAISHVQVSRQPKCFFVLNESKVEKFGSWCIVNPRIVKKSIPSTFPEGCMSFMFRQPKPVKRFARVTVTYWTPLFNAILVPRIRKFKNLEAFIVQHEIEHQNGQNIYGL